MNIPSGLGGSTVGVLSILLTTSIPVVAGASGIQSPEVQWVTAGLADFARGEMGAGGTNLYVSAAGHLQMIQQLDLNQDGHLDLLFNQSHDYSTKVDSIVYWNGQGGFSAERHAAIPAIGGYRALSADVNGDGHSDLVVVNRFDGTTHHVSSFIYWGGPAGLNLSTRTALPTAGATGAAAGDINRDGYPDLVFANGGSLEAFLARKIDDRESHLYWGTRDGFGTAHRSVLPAVNPVGVEVGDLDADGWPEVIFANSGPESPGLFIYHNQAGSLDAERRDTLPLGDPASILLSDLNLDGRLDLVITRNKTEAAVLWNRDGRLTPDHLTVFLAPGANCASVGDLNGDGFPDLVIGGEQTTIYWGRQGWDLGPSASTGNRRVLEIAGVTGCSVADLNSDGRTDLVLARYRDRDTFDLHSLVLWGGADGLSLARHTGLPTQGATDVRSGDFNGDSRPDLAFINNIGGRTRGDINSFLYLGNAAGEFSTDRRIELPGHSAYKSSAADVNDDGFVDIVLSNGWDDEPTGAGTSFIYWGGPAGFASDRRLELPVGGSYGCSVADLNRDGYLDLVFSNTFTKEETVHLPRADFGPYGGVIYWGGQAGYTPARRSFLSAAAPTGNRLADFNRDGYLDILFTTWMGGDAMIFWGGPEGYSDVRRTSVPSIASVNAEIADLNHDGWLDLVLCNHIDRVTLIHKVPSYVYYGSPDGFSIDRRLELPTLGAHDASVADLNGDGNLDLVFSNYHADTTRTPPSYIYWGDAAGRFDVVRRTELPTNSAAGHLVADLNHDGRLEIVFSNHSLDGDHKTNSYLYWGGADSSAMRRTELPTVGPHNMYSVDVGDLYRRSPEEIYLSAPYQADGRRQLERVEWTAQTPFDTAVRVQVRTAASREALAEARWAGPNGVDDAWRVSGDKLAKTAGSGPWYQYRVILHSPDGGSSPRVSRVELVFR